MASHGTLRLEGWKGFHTELGLWPMTFLPGPDGSGKRSVLEALALISHLAGRGWPDGVLSRHGEQPPDSTCTVEFR
ncbi:MAG: hypothetical protein HY722_05185 [Planctomycetes bacterium]|nr:hypothetical protein [Planctomycetota bacterium]